MKTAPAKKPRGRGPRCTTPEQSFSPRLDKVKPFTPRLDKVEELRALPAYRTGAKRQIAEALEASRVDGQPPHPLLRDVADVLVRLLEGRLL